MISIIKLLVLSKNLILHKRNSAKQPNKILENFHKPRPITHKTCQPKDKSYSNFQEISKKLEKYVLKTVGKRLNPTVNFKCDVSPINHPISKTCFLSSFPWSVSLVTILFLDSRTHCHEL